MEQVENNVWSDKKNIRYDVEISFDDGNSDAEKAAGWLIREYPEYYGISAAPE